MKRALGPLACLLMAVLAGACAGPGRPAELPGASGLVAAHNERIERIDRLWARTSVRVEGRDAEGSRFAEQGEGHLQIVTPDRVAVTVGKLGEVYFALGSNESRYWLVDVSNSERRVMLVGEQASATPAKAAALGLPVHPRDIPMLMGLLPLEVEALSEPWWDGERGAVAVRVPARWGHAELRYDPRTLELVGSAAYDAAGELVAEASLGLHGVVTDQQGIARLGRTPRRIEIRVPGFDGFVRMQLDEPEVRAINDAVFNPERLRRAYRVEEVIDLDAPPPEHEE